MDNMTALSKEQVKHIADLVCLALTEREIEQFEKELNNTISMIHEIQKIDVTNVEPTTNPIPLEAYMRPDVPDEPLPREELLKSAPATEDGMFVAPRILGEE